MQTTLLGFAVAIILALVAALVGPFLVDWNQFRSGFEAEGSRMVGAPVHINGAIDARLLPSPSLTVQDLTIGDVKDPRALKVRAMNVEFSLGALMRGDLRAEEAKLSGPEITLGLEKNGSLDLPPVAVDFNPDAISIDRLMVEDGRAHLVDAANGKDVILDKLWFNGSVQSLVGPLKGEGAFVAAGELYGYRVSAGRRDGSGAMRLHLSLDPSDRPVTAEADGALKIGQDEPSFEGTLKLARPASLIEGTGRAAVTLPWRISSKVKIKPSDAEFRQVAFHYGADASGVQLAGNADLHFGKKPLFKGVLSATQLDVDRLIATPATPMRPPVDALKTLIARFVGTGPLPIPAVLSISADSITLGGQSLLTFGGDLHSLADGGWDLDRIEFRAPGLSQVNLSGRLDLAPALGFSGPVSMESGDPAALAGWLEGRGDVKARIKPFKATGDVVLNQKQFAVQRLKAEVDRKPLAGSVNYHWASGTDSSRLDADLAAPDIDLDSILAFAGAVRSATSLDLPQQIALQLDIDRARIAGVEAKSVHAKLARDAKLIDVKQLSVADLGGASIAAQGRIDTAGKSPRGSIVLDLKAKDLDGVMAVVTKFAPEAVDPLRRAASQVGTTQLRATLALDGPAQPARGADAVVRFAVEGKLGGLRASVRGQASEDSTKLAAEGVAALASGAIRLDAQIDGDDGPALLALLGLDKVFAVGKGPGFVNLAANGRMSSDLHVEGRILAAGLDGRANGSARITGEQGPSAKLKLDIAKANVTPLRGPVKSGEALPLTLHTGLTLSETGAKLDDVIATIAGSELRGALALDLGSPAKLSGRIVADKVDANALIATAVGLRPASGTAGAAVNEWSSEPFAPALVDRLGGAIDITVARAALTPDLTAHRITAKLAFAGPQISLEQLDAQIAGGTLSGRLSVDHHAREISTAAELTLAGVDAAALLPGDVRPAIGGRVSAKFDLQAEGLSPKALVGSLAGTGSVSLDDGFFSRLDPAVFQTAIRASDRGMATDVPKLHDIAAAALDSGRLRIPHLETTVAVSAGQARFAQAFAKVEGANLAATGSIDLVQQQIDARLTLTGPAAESGDALGRPDLYVSLKGPIAQPDRRIDVSALSGWLTIRSIERQAKKLEALEQARHEQATREEARRAAAQKQPAAQPQAAVDPIRTPLSNSSNPAVSAEAARAEAERLMAAPSVTGSSGTAPPSRSPQPLAQGRSSAAIAPPEPAAPSSASQAELPPPLPAPLEIRRVPSGPDPAAQAFTPEAAHAPLVLPSVGVPPQFR